jgi:cyanophycinase
VAARRPSAIVARVGARAPGPLILVGGAEFGPGNEPHDDRWVAAVAGRPAYIVASAATRQDPDRAVVTARSWFRRLGIEVEELRLRGRRDAADAAVVYAARDGGGFYLCGGDPGLTIEILRETPAWSAIVEAWRDGAAIAGSSAGAMALGEWSLIRAGMSHARRRFAPALALVPRVAVVPHHDEFGAGWLASLRPPRADVVLLGLDSRTAAGWWPGVGWRTHGPGEVRVIGREGERWRDRQVHRGGRRPTGLPRPRAPR